MNTRIISAIATATIAASTPGACAGMSTRDENSATGGSTVGTVGCAVVGGVIGNQVDLNKR